MNAPLWGYITKVRLLVRKMAKIKQFIDIGANLTDSMYQGLYNGNQKHRPDLLEVLKRGWDAGLAKIIITGGSLSESKAALDMAQLDERLFSTVGCHPTRCLEFEENSEDYYANLKKLAENASGKVVAIGETGLDYDRLQFCPKDTQKIYFEKQLQLSKDLNLPLFLHCRKAAEDLAAILRKFPNLRGVVHSFDGSELEASMFVEMGFYIGINGCSLKTGANLLTVKSIPIDRLLIETDCPWCEIRPAHAGYRHIRADHILTGVKKEKWRPDAVVKGRNEPANIRQIVDVLSVIRGENSGELAEKLFENSQKLFFPATII